MEVGPDLNLGSAGLEAVSKLLHARGHSIDGLPDDSNLTGKLDEPGGNEHFGRGGESTTVSTQRVGDRVIHTFDT